MGVSLIVTLFVVSGRRIDFGVADEGDKSPQSVQILSVDREGNFRIECADRRQTLCLVCNPFVASCQIS